MINPWLKGGRSGGGAIYGTYFVILLLCGDWTLLNVFLGNLLSFTLSKSWFTQVFFLNGNSISSRHLLTSTATLNVDKNVYFSRFSFNRYNQLMRNFNRISLIKTDGCSGILLSHQLFLRNYLQSFNTAFVLLYQFHLKSNGKQGSAMKGFVTVTL